MRCYLHSSWILIRCNLHSSWILMRCYLHSSWILMRCYLHSSWILMRWYLHSSWILMRCNLCVTAVQEERNRGKDGKDEVESTSCVNNDMPVDKILEAELAVEPKHTEYHDSQVRPHIFIRWPVLNLLKKSEKRGQLFFFIFLKESNSVGMNFLCLIIVFLPCFNHKK